MNYIYALADQATGEYRYVGKTTRLKDRLRAHINRAATTPGARRCASWIAGLLAAGKRPELVVLEVVATEWEAAEKRWVAEMLRRGCNLTNMTEGGGFTGPRPSTTDEVRQKISAAAKRQFANPAARDAAARYARDAWADPALRVRLVHGRREVAKQPEFIRKQSEAKRALWATDEYRNKVTAAQRAADHSTGAKKMWERPEYRAKQAAARAAMAARAAS